MSRPIFQPMETDTPRPDSLAAMRLGWFGRCPRCGEGRLFGRFLKMNAACPHCGQSLEPYRADDAPAYFTIFIVGHVVVPLVLLVEKWGEEPSLWLHAALWLPLSVGLALYLLPRIKGAVIALLWAQRAGVPPLASGRGYTPPQRHWPAAPRPC